MSNSTDTTGCISHRRHNRFFIMFEDFLDVAKISEHQHKLAAFWRILETKMNDRMTYNKELIEDCKKKGLPEPETSLWIEISYSEFVNRSLGVYKSSSFQVAAAESERLGFSQSRQLKRPIHPNDPDSPLEDYKEYLFLTNVMQSVLNGGEYPPPIEINSPLLKSIADRKEAQKKKRAIEKNSTPIEINSPPTETPIEINSTPLLISIGNKYRDKNTKDNGRIESVADDISTPTSAPIVATTPTLSSLSLFSEEETKAKLSTSEPTSPIEAPASTPTQEKKVPSKKKKVETAEPKGPPVMPPVDAPWPSKETAVQIVEAKKGRIYSTTTRKQELTEAGAILEMTIDNMPITREQFDSAWDDLASSSWWEEHGKPCMIKYLRRDDTIVGIVKKLAKKGQARTKTTSPQSRPTTTARADLGKTDAAFERLIAEAAALETTGVN